MIGVSPDEPSGLRKFAAKYSLDHTLLGDPDHSVAEAYGVWVPGVALRCWSGRSAGSARRSVRLGRAPTVSRLARRSLRLGRADPIHVRLTDGACI